MVADGINEVRATCRLFVRLVTEEMLNNSITVRINNMHRSAFLSPLYDLFVSAVATIVPTTEDNIFIINIQEDNEVQEKILNVSFSVRQRTEYSQDVFYKPQFLKERFYFQRMLMTKLSTLEVDLLFKRILLTSTYLLTLYSELGAVVFVILQHHAITIIIVIIIIIRVVVVILNCYYASIKVFLYMLILTS